MNSKRFYFALLGASSLLIVAVGLATVGAYKFLQNQGNKLTDVKIENRVVEEQQNFLIQAKTDLEKYNELGQITKAIVPQDKNQAKTVREINAIASRSGIQLGSIVFETSTLGNKPAVQSTQPTEGGAPADPSSPGQPTAPTNSLTQVKPVVGIPGVYSLEITISSGSPTNYYQFLGFLNNLESNRRTAHVKKIVLNPVERGARLNFVLTLNAYLKP